MCIVLPQEKTQERISFLERNGFIKREASTTYVITEKGVARSQSITEELVNLIRPS
jgi:predicted transcriptional regulator